MMTLYSVTQKSMASFSALEILTGVSVLQQPDINCGYAWQVKGQSIISNLTVDSFCSTVCH